MIYKKLFLWLALSSLSVITIADEVATNFMLINNYATRQSVDIWQRMRAGFKMQHEQSTRVKYFEQMYTKNPQAFYRMMNNAVPYLYFMLTQIERNGLPAELALVPGVETTFNPFAINPTDAYAGMWQFVPATGRQYNMLQNNSIDERRDIVKSTNAAIVYFVYLYSLFGQWDVAIGAYNWGQGNMYKAIINSHQKIGQANYNTLKLRKITADYVPKVIALASIIENPAKFGVVLPYQANQPYFAIVNPVKNVEIDDFERTSDINDKVFSVLNPQFKTTSYVLTNQNQVLLPQINQNVYYARMGQALPQPLTAPEILVASNTALQNQSGKANLQQVALNTAVNSPAAEVIPGIYATTKSAKISLTESKVTTTVVALAPSTESIVTSSVSPSANANQIAQNIVTKLPTNQSESQLDGLINNLSLVNNKNTKRVDRNSGNSQAITVRVTEPEVKREVVLAASKVKKLYYKVGAGDTLYSIARKFNTKVEDIKLWNKIHSNSLSIGQILTILMVHPAGKL